jgi:glycosyltransferase involved in cell wall biosynthesis
MRASDGNTPPAKPSAKRFPVLTQAVLDAMMLAQRLNLGPPAPIARPLRRAARAMLVARSTDAGLESWDQPLIRRRDPLSAAPTNAPQASQGVPRSMPPASPTERPPEPRVDASTSPRSPPEFPSIASRPAPMSCLLATSSLDVGGMDEVVAFFARRLPRHGVVTTVVHAVESRVAGGTPTGWLGRQLSSEGIRTLQLDATAGRKFIEELRPQVISAHDPPPWVLEAAIRHAIPYVETLHGMHSLFNADWAAEAKRSTTIAFHIAVSELVRQQYLHGNPHFPPSRIRTIPNGVDDERRVLGNRQQARARLGLTDEFLFVSLARHCLQKNTYGLVDAFDDVAARHPRAHLVIAGRPDDPGYFGQVLRLRERLKHGNRVHLRDHTAEPAELLAAADGFVLDSFFEGWSLASMEALYSGVPVVLSEVGGATEQVGADSRRGICVPNPLGDPLAVNWDSIRTRRFARQVNREPLVGAMDSLVVGSEEWLRSRPVLAAESARRFHPDECVRRHRQVLADAIDQARATPSSRHATKETLAPVK